MADPAGYFLTWTTYGAWVHGDARGSVDASHNEFASMGVRPDAALERQRRDAMTEPPFRLSAAARKIVMACIVDHCGIRGWTLEAVNVRAEHVHCVVRCGGVRPEQAMQQFKAWSTRRLRESGALGDRKNVWTDHGSTRYLWDDAGVADSSRYVLLEQGEDLGTCSGRLWEMYRGLRREGGG